MILALDVGNTNITCGVFDSDRIKASFRITTKMPRTSDEYGMLLSTLLERNQVGMDDIHDAIEYHAFTAEWPHKILQYQANNRGGGHQNRHPYRHTKSAANWRRPYSRRRSCI